MACTMVAEPAKSGYYDIVFVGRTGSGKSTTGNKVLHLGNSSAAIHRFTSSESGGNLLENQSAKLQFTEGSDFRPTTLKCELLANEESRIRVLDVPGFGSLSSFPEPHGQLQIWRWISQIQKDHELKIMRVVYFLPSRGRLEKADGTLQQELQTMYRFYKKSIFECMVVAATIKKYQQPFSTEDRRHTESLFRSALNLIVKPDEIKCPPLIFIGLNDDGNDILRKIRAASVLSDSILPSSASMCKDDKCTNCSTTVYYDVYSKRIGIIGDNGDLLPYGESKCHVKFIPRYNTIQKCLCEGMHLFCFRQSPRLNTADEICIVCKQPRGSEGCTVVGEMPIEPQQPMACCSCSRIDWDEVGCCPDHEHWKY